MKKKWTVYIIECVDGRFYTGITVDLKRRFKEHCESSKGAKFFNTTSAKKIVYEEVLANRSLASKREAHIKKLRRTQKEELILKAEKT